MKSPHCFNMLQLLQKLSIIATILCFSAACSDYTSPANAWELDDEPQTNSSQESATNSAQTQTNSAASNLCDPLNDTCPEGKYCQYADGVLRCVTEGDVLPDYSHVPPACPGICSRGGICMPSDYGVDEAACFQPCALAGVNQNSNCVNSRHTCRQAYGDNDEPLTFGLCNY